MKSTKMPSAKPTSDEVQYIRSKVKEHIDTLEPGDFNESDIKRLNEDEFFVARFFKHVFYDSGSQVDNAVEMVKSFFKWRSENKVADLSEQTTSDVLKQKGSLFKRNRDKDGCQMLFFVVKSHCKGSENMKDMKDFFIFLLERIDREDSGKPLTIVFDCEGAGVKNMDIEFVQYIISVFKDYYPYYLNNILVYDMNWVLSAAWNAIRLMLPKHAIEKIKFVKKSSIQEYVSSENLPSSMGGDDDWVYEYIPEIQRVVLKEPTRELVESSVNDTVLSETRSIKSLKTNTYKQEKPMQKLNLMSITPSDDILFSPSTGGKYYGSVKLKNVFSKSIAFKFKTTSPDNYRVRPSMAYIFPNETCVIDIQVLNATPQNGKDKFLIAATSTDSDKLNYNEISELMKSREPQCEHRLRCTFLGLSTKIETPNNAIHSTPLSNGLHANNPNEVLLKAMKKQLNELTEGQLEMQNKLEFLTNALYVIFGLYILKILVNYFFS